MALYDLSDDQNKNIKAWLENINFQGNRKQRKALDLEMDNILEKLNKPIHPSGKPKKETELIE